MTPEIAGMSSAGDSSVSAAESSIAMTDAVSLGEESSDDDPQAEAANRATRAGARREEVLKITGRR